ncbi:uncharacterized protein LOC127719499 isoform X2 [Mytilus californianus]|uniref:uncharacterized protein LOC127719499 isoform X2 n=1 Tax=Mytilus californianus TaxID=6549 RepID=UPI0022451D36|nr:uncharacterized protein LOC127719499 isoform X2 [Mytilus californianus]
MALSKVAAIPSLPEEETNFLRFANLLIRISPKAVRVVFDKYFQPCGLNVVLNQSKEKLETLKKKKILNKSQMDLLYPIKGYSKSSDMDLTLMICLLRNLQKMKIEDILPAAALISEEADLSRIKYYRNWIAHNTTGYIDKEDFLAMWTNVCEAIQRIGGASFKTECDILMSSDLDSSYREVYVSFAQQERRLEKVEEEYNKVDEELQSAMEKICQLEESKDNTKDNLLLEVAAWEQDNKKFFPTSTVKTILEKVEHTSFVVISGSGGMGKSATAYHIALLFRNMKGYEILPINEPSDILKFCKTGRKQIVIIDDLCGKFAIDNRIVSSWIRLKTSITRLIRLAKDSLRIVATCRLHVSKCYQFQKLMQAFEITECDLLSDELVLDVDEKREIGLCHLNEECLNSLGEEVIAQTDMFPLLCKLSAKKTFNPDFFKKPYDFLETELDGMALENKECFFGLALLVLFNNNLKKSLFEDRCNIMFNEMFDGVFEELEMSDRPSRLFVLRSLETLKGTFIKENESSVSAIHDKVFDFIAFFIGKMLLKTILKYGNSYFISERMSFEFLDELTEDDFVIMLDKDHEELYFQRIIQEIGNRNFSIVFSNKIAKTTYYQGKLIALLSKQDATLSMFTGNIWALVSSVFADCDMLYTFIIEERLKKINCEQTSDTKSKAEGTLSNVLFDTEIKYEDDDIGLGFLSSSNGPLMIAIAESREDIIRVLLESGNAININETFLIYDSEITPLLLSYFSKQLDITKMLIEYKADVNVQYFGGKTLLHFFCEDGSIDYLELILGSKEWDVNRMNDLEETPLFLACRRGKTKCVELLVASQCDINSSNVEGKSPLHIACSEGNADIIRILLNTDYCKIDHCDNDYNTALMISCERCNMEIVQLLILHGCNLNTANVHGRTALHIASTIGYTVIVQLLISNECEINLCDNDNQTPLNLATENYQKTCIGLLISNGCDVNICNLDGQTSLHIACKRGHADIVDLILNTNRCDIDKLDDNQDSSLAIACTHGRKDIVDCLILKKCNINTVNSFGLSPLHIAIRSDYMEIVQTLIQNGCDINLCDANKQTPLFCACEMGICSAVQLLLQKGCDSNICNSDGLTPLEIANDNGFLYIVSYFSKNKKSNEFQIIYSRI